MSGFNPSIGSSNFSNSSFFRQINQARSQATGERVTINDLVQDQLRGTQQTQEAQSTDQAESESTGAADSVAEGRVIETGRQQDVRTEGESFIALGSGESQRFTQSVSLEVSDDGTVQDQLSGRNLQETVEDNDGNTVTQDLQLSDDQRTSEAQATTQASISGNFSQDIARGDSVQFEGDVTNASGGTETVNFRATRTGDSEFELTAQDPRNGDTALEATVSFDAEGTTENVEIRENDSGFEGLSFEGGDGNEVQVSEDSLSLSGLTFGQQDGETTVGVTDENGRSSGQLEGVTVTENGQLQGDFSNGETRTFGEIATAEFGDPSGLTALDNGQFVSNGISGEADFSADVSVQAGELETQDSTNTQNIADVVLGGTQGSGSLEGPSRNQLLGAVLDLSA